MPRWVAGVDGCKSGWVAVFLDAEQQAAPQCDVFANFAGLLDCPQAPEIVAIDMPIGLPERVGRGGRGPEQAVRPLLGQRQSSVFSVPARAAVYAEDYAQACAIALEYSDPPRKVSKQCFHLFPKMREIDALMTPALEARVYEVHPEVAFWRLNGGRAMALPKKIKSRASGPGLDERQLLLVSKGFDQAFFDAPRPKGVAADDRLDACANALIALRLLAGEAEAFPADYGARRQGPAGGDLGLSAQSSSRRPSLRIKRSRLLSHQPNCGCQREKS